MKKMQIVLVLTILMITKAYSQPMHKHWDYTYGGSGGDAFYKILKMQDGGYILAGGSSSGAGGDKSEANRGNSNDPQFNTSDYWIVKTNAEGIKEWDRTFGGSAGDGLFAACATNDGGCLLGGYSDSDISGDKTAPSKGGSDYWVVKVDKNGNKEWDKAYGGAGNDYLYGAIIQTSDGGYLLGGQSSSGISGDKSEPVRGSPAYHDYWVVKIDSLGNKQWDKTYGGDNQESLTSLLETSDGGYLIGGYSKSGISGDKTEENIGGFDWWVLKVDSTGNIEWDKTYGTTNSEHLYDMIVSYNNDIILVGGGFRYRIIAGTGDIITEGGFVGCAVIERILKTTDMGYLLSGEAYEGCVGGPIFPDKTEANLGRYQTWFVKTDSAFNKQWDKTVFSVGEDMKGRTLETDNGCYVTGCYSNSDVGGYKSQSSRGGNDYWIVKLCEDPNFIPTLTTEEGVSVIVYPNPFVNEVAIRLQKEQVQEATYVLTTIDGRILYQQHETHLAAGYTKIWDLSPLPSGVYLISVNIKGVNITKRVVKR